MVNRDDSEIAKFDEARSQWWDLSGEYKPLHDINPARLSFVQSHVDLNGQRVLDVGCGGGILTEAMAHAGAQVTGIDLNESAINAAKNHAENQSLQLEYELLSVEELVEQRPAHYQTVTCMELLEHVPDPKALVQQCAQALDDAGWLFVSTLNRNIQSFLTAIVGAEYIAGLLPKGTHHYKRLIRPSELASWVEKAGLRVQTIRGLSYNPITRRACISSKPTVNYIMACCRA